MTFRIKVKGDAFKGCVFLLVLILALTISNSHLSPYYEKIIEIPVFIGIAEYTITKPLLLWVNEGLMSVFFMLLTMEVKYNLIVKKSIDKSMLVTSIICATGGISFSTIIYFLFNYSDSIALHGLGIVTTTDTAVVLAILAIFGDHISKNIRIFMLILSIIDDVLAIFIVAIFYTSSLSLGAILFSLLGSLIILVLNIKNVSKITPYVLTGIFIWFCVLQSGIHATLAGVMIGFSIPIFKGDRAVTFHQFENYLKSWVYFLILPVFIFMNSGVSFLSFSSTDFLSHISLGIVVAMLFGKSIGAFLFFIVGCVLNVCQLPKNVNVGQMLALCFLTGVGFTMSLFLATLAFNGTNYEDISTQSVLIGSFLSFIIGVLLLLYFTKSNRYNKSAKR